MIDIFDIFADAGANEVVLNPAIGALDFTFGLRSESIDRFNVTIVDNLFPLRIDVVGKLLKTMVSLIAAPDVTENGMAVSVIS